MQVRGAAAYLISLIIRLLAISPAPMRVTFSLSSHRVAVWRTQPTVTLWLIEMAQCLYSVVPLKED